MYIYIYRERERPSTTAEQTRGYGEEGADVYFGKQQV